MGLFTSKKYGKNVVRDNEFLKDYAIKCNRLLMYVEDNEKLIKEINLLKDDFQYTVPSPSADAKKREKSIEKEFNTLVQALQQPEIDEAQVLLMIRNLRGNVVEIASMR